MVRGGAVPVAVLGALLLLTRSEATYATGNRVCDGVSDPANLGTLIAALFMPSINCSRLDVNADGRISAPDLTGELQLLAARPTETSTAAPSATETNTPTPSGTAAMLPTTSVTDSPAASTTAGTTTTSTPSGIL